MKHEELGPPLPGENVPARRKPDPPAQTERTSAPAPPARTAMDEMEMELVSLVSRAGTLKITEAQRQVLFAPVKEEDVEIRPDGLIYLPWMEYVSRLRDSFGLSWAVVPKGQPRLNPDKDGIIWGFYLIVDGVLAGYAIGEAEYQAANRGMTWSDVCESAKSNALMRLCKGLGISLELWKPGFVRAWKEKWAETVAAFWPNGRPKLDQYGRPKMEWRKKAAPGAPPGEAAEEQKPGPRPEHDDGEGLPSEEEPEPETKRVRRPAKATTKAKAAPATEDRKMTEQEEKEAIATRVKGRLAELEIDPAQFKEWLFHSGLQDKLDRYMVVINQWGHYSFTDASLRDARALEKNLTLLVEKFQEAEAQKEESGEKEK